MVEKSEHPGKDPTQRLYEGLAAEARADVLKRAHDTKTWRYRRRPPLRFRASEAGNCPRQLFYRLMGCVPAPDKPSLKLKQLEGNLAQDVVRQLYLKHGVEMGGIEVERSGTVRETLDKVSEFEVSGERIKVSARADGEFDTPYGHALFEFKTATGNSMRWLQTALDRGGKEGLLDRIHKKHPYYVNQIQITMAVFGRSLTYLQFKNKDTTDYGFVDSAGNRCGVYILYDQNRVDELLGSFAHAQKCVATGNPPDIALCPLDGSRECDWCPFYYRCYGAMNNGGKVVYPSSDAE